MQKDKVKRVQQNTLKMIRNNMRYECLLEKIILIIKNNSNKNNNFEISKAIDLTLKTIEEYDL